MNSTQAIAQLRHLYANLINGGVQDASSAKQIAKGLLSPAIAALERETPERESKTITWRYRMRGDLQWQYTERKEQFTHADHVQALTVQSIDKY